jgi:hypothetical protein
VGRAGARARVWGRARRWEWEGAAIGGDGEGSGRRAETREGKEEDGSCARLTARWRSGRFRAAQWWTRSSFDRRRDMLHAGRWWSGGVRTRILPGAHTAVEWAGNGWAQDYDTEGDGPELAH